MKIFFNCLFINYQLLKAFYRNIIFFNFMIVLSIIITSMLPITRTLGYKIPDNILLIFESIITFFIITLPMHSRQVVCTVVSKDLLIHYPISNVKRVIYSTFSLISNPEILICFVSSGLTIFIMDISELNKLFLILLMYLVIFNVIVWDRFIFETFRKWSEAIGFVIFIILIGVFFSSKLLYKFFLYSINLSSIQNINFVIIFLFFMFFIGFYLIYLVDKNRLPQSNYTISNEKTY